jgi:hypothetical protein
LRNIRRLKDLSSCISKHRRAFSEVFDSFGDTDLLRHVLLQFDRCIEILLQNLGFDDIESNSSSAFALAFVILSLLGM